MDFSNIELCAIQNTWKTVGKMEALPKKTFKYALMKKYHGTTMVQLWYTTVNSGIPWYGVTVPMVQITCTMVNCGIPWYILTVPWYILVQPWYKELVPWHIMIYHGTLCSDHGTSLHNHSTIWNTMEYDGTSSYHHGTNFLHHGMLWFTIVQPLWTYTIVHQNTIPLYNLPCIYHCVVRSIYPLVNLYHVSNVLNKRSKKKQKTNKKLHTHTRCFGCGIMFHNFLTTLLCLWNFYFRKILTILVAIYIGRSISPITLQYCIERILVHLSLLWITMCYMCASL